jgi:hypothetical protein
VAANAPSARPTPVELALLRYPVLDAPPLPDEDGPMTTQTLARRAETWPRGRWKCQTPRHNDRAG